MQEALNYFHFLRKRYVCNHKNSSGRIVSSGIPVFTLTQAYNNQRNKINLQPVLPHFLLFYASLKYLNIANNLYGDVSFGKNIFSFF